MTRDELEFSISQYLDGTLAARERDALDERLATDADARAILAEYQALQGVLVVAPTPEIDWDRFAARVSSAVAREELPATSYKIGRWFQPARLAIAASVLVAAGLAFSVLRPGNDGNTNTGGPRIAVAPISIKAVDNAGAAQAIAQGPTQVNVNPAPATPIQIVIGPAPSAGAGSPAVAVRYADSVVQRPSKALIVSAAPTVQDSLLAPF